MAFQSQNVFRRDRDKAERPNFVPVLNNVLVPALNNVQDRGESDKEVKK